MFKAAGFSNIVEYRYWKEETRSLDFEGMLEDLEVMELTLFSTNTNHIHPISEIVRAFDL